MENRYKFKDRDSLDEYQKEHKENILYYDFIQYLFFYQWNEIKSYANNKGIKIFGDIPIFVAYDSSDVWGNPDYFYLDERGEMEYVAGVPPDEFSETGQRWGNPLYRWDILKKNNFDWWIQRIQHSFKLVDFLRIDHFRGFESYWRIPSKEPTAKVGNGLRVQEMNFLGH
jgi:4-alpha-glucanotransferase